MKCFYCDCADSKVIDSRSVEESNSIRRRRECLGCGKRFTTYEIVENTPILVVKKSGDRQVFNPEKIKNGIYRACEKRPVSASQIEKIVKDIEKKIQNSLEQEISTTKIGELVMEALRDVDEVAYVRFASVYKQFKDISSFSKLVSDFDKPNNKKQ